MPHFYVPRIMPTCRERRLLLKGDTAEGASPWIRPCLRGIRNYPRAEDSALARHRSYHRMLNTAASRSTDAESTTTRRAVTRVSKSLLSNVLRSLSWTLHGELRSTHHDGSRACLLEVPSTYFHSHWNNCNSGVPWSRMHYRTAGMTLNLWSTIHQAARLHHDNIIPSRLRPKQSRDQRIIQMTLPRKLVQITEAFDLDPPEIEIPRTTTVVMW
ncbi:hypothetical protein OH76DRAFT_432536 [Lentinus brumalis]|uniref:Uncharacterized protein n=1 Tax=Lentinus brumalis TaxID=2498619 RepID=A0A371DDM6_9APHY|nr:hypothetical protein OH76DRAFT_432536 [Polyporus brumalis]